MYCTSTRTARAGSDSILPSNLAFDKSVQNHSNGIQNVSYSLTFLFESFVHGVNWLNSSISLSVINPASRTWYISGKRFFATKLTRLNTIMLAKFKYLTKVRRIIRPLSSSPCTKVEIKIDILNEKVSYKFLISLISLQIVTCLAILWPNTSPTTSTLPN